MQTLPCEAATKDHSPLFTFSSGALLFWNLTPPGAYAHVGCFYFEASSFLAATLEEFYFDAPFILQLRPGQPLLWSTSSHAVSLRRAFILKSTKIPSVVIIPDDIQLSHTHFLRVVSCLPDHICVNACSRSGGKRKRKRKSFLKDFSGSLQLSNHLFVFSHCLPSTFFFFFFFPQFAH